MWLVYLAGLVGLAATTAGLQDFLTPISYDLTFSFDKSDIFNVEAYIQFKASDNIGPDVKNVILNGHGFNISEVIFLYPSTKKIHIPPTSVVVNEKEETLSFPLSEQMAKSGVYKLRVLYSAKIGTETGIVATQLGNERYLTTVLYPAFARKLYPCFDTPNMRATYDITVKVNYGHKEPSIVTGLPMVDNRQTNKNNKQLVVKYSSATMKLPPYGITFTIGNYVSPTGSNNFMIPASMDENTVNENLMFALAAPSIKQMASAAGFDFTLVLIPDLPVKSVSGHGFAGIRQAMGIDVSTLTTDGQLQSQLDILVALVKSIYGTVVSPGSWTDIWISESVSLYIAHKILPKIKRFAAWENVELADIQQAALERTWSDTSSPVMPSSFSSIDQLIKFLSDPAIHKGATILGMIESLPQNYQPPNAFVNFIKDRKGNAVTTDELLDRYADYTQLNVSIPLQSKLKDIVKPWLTQTGYPAIEISRKNNEILASESVFRSTTAPKSFWVVPLYFNILSNNTNDASTLKWLNSEPNTELQLVSNANENDTVAVNVRGPGLYRVHYQSHELDLLIARLQSNVNSIPASVRSTLLSDAIAFANAGSIKFSQLFTMMNYLVNERELGPWKVASRTLDQLWSLMYFSDLKVTFENYSNNLVRPLFIDRNIGGLGLKDSSLVNGQLRKIILNHLCDYQDENCMDALTGAYAEYLPARETEIIATDVVPIVYCGGLKGLKDSTVVQQYFKQKYNPTDPADLKRSLFSYMACPQNVTVLSDFLELALLKSDTTGQELPGEDSVIAFEEVVRRPEQMNFLVDFVQKNYVTLNPNLQSKHIAQMISAFGEVASTEDHLKMLNFNFGNSSEISDAVKRATESIQIKIKMLKDNHDDMNAGMQGLTPPTPTETPQPTQPPSSTPAPSPKPTDKPNGAQALSATLLLFLTPLALLAAS